MTDHAIAPAHAVEGGHHEDPMSHVPPPSLWPFLVMLGLITLPFGVLSVLGALDGSPVGPLKDPRVGVALIVGSTLMFLFCLMGWANQVIKEKRIAHDVVQQQKDLQMFILLFLCGEAAAFGAIFGYFYHRTLHDATFGPLPGQHFGGPLAAYATFFLLSSSLTCEVAHHAIHDGKRLLGKLFLIVTLVLGGIFLGMTGYEWGELLQRGFKPSLISESGASSFAALFYTYGLPCGARGHRLGAVVHGVDAPRIRALPGEAEFLASCRKLVLALRRHRMGNPLHHRLRGCLKTASATRLRRAACGVARSSKWRLPFHRIVRLAAGPQLRFSVRKN